MGKLDGKVAIVTGAARGLGRAYAKRLAGLGAKVAVADLNLRSYEVADIDLDPQCAPAQRLNLGDGAVGGHVFRVGLEFRTGRG